MVVVVLLNSLLLFTYGIPYFSSTLHLLVPCYWIGYPSEGKVSGILNSYYLIVIMATVLSFGITKRYPFERFLHRNIDEHILEDHNDGDNFDTLS